MSLSYSALSLRFLRIEGVDALKFLQGQCSCDLQLLTAENYLYGTLNTPKGRIYCFFKVVLTENGLLLGMESSLFDASLAKLKKYAVFFKCALEEAKDYTAWGLYSPEPVNQDTTLFSNTAFACQQYDNYYVLSIAQTPLLGQLWVNGSDRPETISSSTEISADQWNALEASCGIPAIYNESVEEFILQNLNLQQLNTVSFKKGCYTGQEIIARMKFLGKLKKKTYLLRTNSNLRIHPLMSFVDENGSKVGTLVRGHWSEETGLIALGIFNIEDALELKKIYLESDNSVTFTISELNYQQFSA